MFGQMRGRRYSSGTTGSNSDPENDRSLRFLSVVILLLAFGLILLQINTKSGEQVQLKAKIRELTSREEGVPVPHYTMYYATIETPEQQIYVARSSVPFSVSVGQKVTITIHDELVFGKRDRTVVDKVE
jgi:hypothetical protein